MTCRDFSLVYSAHLDGRADEWEGAVLRKHLAECPACKCAAAGMRSLRAEMRTMDRPRANPEMISQIQSSLRRESRARASYASRHADLLDLWRTRIFSQGVGAVVSIALLVLVSVGILNPAYRTLALAQAATAVLLDRTESDEIRLKVLLLQPPPPPVFNPSGELLGIGESLSEDDEIIATVRVSKDGRASINRIVMAPHDPSVINRFSSVITHQASFQPAPRNRNTSAEAVVIFSKVRITG